MTFGNNTLLCINNAFIEALNRQEHLSKYILVILDRDLIDMINCFDFGITVQLERSIKWLGSQFYRHLAARRDQIWNIKLGGISYDDTKIIWIEMFDCPVIDPAVNICNKFNKGLNEVAHARKNHHILIVGSLKNNKHFKRNGKLNYWGKMQFWREVDFHFKQFDRKKTQMEPHTFTYNPMVVHRK